MNTAILCVSDVRTYACRSSGSMLRTKKQFIFGSVSTRIKLVKGNSAGTVTTYYVSAHRPSYHSCCP